MSAVLASMADRMFSERFRHVVQLTKSLPIPAGNYRAWFLIGDRGTGKSNTGYRLCIRDALDAPATKVVAFGDRAWKEIGAIAAGLGIPHSVDGDVSVRFSNGSRIVGNRWVQDFANHAHIAENTVDGAVLVLIDDADLAGPEGAIVLDGILERMRRSSTKPQLLVTVTDIGRAQVFLAQVAAEFETVVTHVKAKSA